MEPITLVLIGIAVLFFLLLALKNILNLKKTCVICASVTLTWIILLTLYFFKIFNDKMIITILMGQTSLGIYYIFERKARKNTLVFRLPLLLTFIFIIYAVLESFNFNSLIFLIILWLIFALIYSFKNIKGFKRFTTKLIKCCKKW